MARRKSPRRNAPDLTPDERDREPMNVAYETTPTEQGIEVEVPDDIEAQPTVEELEDGSAVVHDVETDQPKGDDSDFYENLAETLDPSYLATLGSNLVEDIKRDKEDRKRRDELYAEGIKRTGLGNEAPGGAEFTGASKAVHPVLVEGCVDFAARAMKELFPPTGPVKSHIIGKVDAAKLQRADRKRRYMNWQLTTRISEYRSELEVLLSQLPLGGAQYQKIWYDTRVERIRTEFIPIDYLHKPAAANDLRNAERVTHEQHLTQMQFMERVASGLYANVDEHVSAQASAIAPEESAAETATNKIQGVDTNLAYNEDGLRTVYETLTFLTLKSSTDEKLDKLAEKDYMPYVITVDEATNKVLALRRNWDMKDNNNTTPLQWIVEWPFVPWRGGPIGLAHIIGSLAGAATGSLRALLDSALINNMPGGIKLKGARIAGQNINIQPTQLSEIEAGPGVDDIRKLAMPYPFNPPSTVLFQLLEWITAQAKGVVGTAEERIGDAGSNMPVGTALALIEQGSINFSSIHARLHDAQKQALAIVHRLNATYIQDEETVEELDELVVSRADFQGPMDIEPVSDPNIFSDTQRFAQLQAGIQLAQMPLFAGLFKPPVLAKRAVALLKLPEGDELLNVPGEPEKLDPIAENYLVGTEPNATLKAFEDQRHVMHLKSHVAFMTSPMFCSNPLMAGPLPKLLEHCREHIMMLYIENVKAAATVHQGMTGAPEAASEMDGLAIAEQALAKELGPLMGPLQQAMKTAQEMLPKPPADPSIEVAKIKAAADSNKVQVENALKQAQATTEASLEQARLKMEDAIEKQRLALEKLAHDDEMRIAERNAQLAAFSEQMTRQSNEQLATMKEYMSSQRSESQAQLSTVLAEMQREREQQNIVLTTLIQGLTGMEPKAKKEGEEGGSEESRPMALFAATQNELRTAITAMMESIAQLAQRPTKPRGWNLIMDPDGNITRLEPDLGIEG